jgi:TolB-like protein/tetratricopeptide (TPR) repeat protein
MLLHTGVHMAEVTTSEEGDVYGDGVNVAARLQEEAGPGEVLVSEDVWRQLRGRADLQFRNVGTRWLKGIPSSVSTYAALPAGSERGRGVAAHRFSRGRRKNLAYLGLGVLIALAALGVSQRFGLWSGGPPSSLDLSNPPPGAPAPEEDASIAVLPFVDMGGEDDGYFADGITEDILTALSKIQGLRVISRTSVMGYRGTNKPIGQIAEELGVATVLEGSVRRSGDRVRITAQLIDARTDGHLWAETYDREMTDIFAIQSEIAAEIAGALETELSSTAGSRIAAARTTNLTAYDLYLRGREVLYDAMSFQDVDEMHDRAVESADLFRRALEHDPEYALAWAGLSHAHLVRQIYEGAAWGDSALAAAQRSVELDPELPDGHLALARVEFERGELAAAERGLRQAIAINPNGAEALGALGGLLAEQGRLDEALPWAGRAAVVEPTNGQYQMGVGVVYALLDDLEPAARWFERAVAVEPRNASAYGWLTLVYIAKDDDVRAARAAERAIAVGPNSPEAWWPVVIFQMRQEKWNEALGYLERWAAETDPHYTPYAELAYVYQKLGQRAKAQDALREAERVAREGIEGGEESWARRYTMAQVSAMRGDPAGALQWLQDARRHGFYLYHYARFDPVMTDVRDDPSIRAELDEMRDELHRMRDRARRAQENSD